MRKGKLFVWFMVFIITLSLFGCQESESTPKYPDAEGVDPAVALRLRKDYLQQLRSEEPETEITLADIYVQAYYGTYSGCEIVYMGTSPVHTGQLRSVVVAGYIITLLGGGHKLYVHKDTHFYTLNEAYDAGYITIEDVEDFGPKVDKHYFRKWNGEVFSEDDNRIIHNPGWADVESKLREDYLRQFGSEYPEMELTLDKISVRGYCGTYSGCEIVQMDSPLWQYITARRSVVVAGYIITFTSDFEPYVHKDDSFYTLKEAYDAGYITKEDVEDFGPKVDPAFKKWEGEPLLDQDALAPAIVLRLRKDYLQQLHAEKPNTKEIVLDEIWVEAYYGTYSGCEIVYMGAPLESITVAERSVIVGGYIFIFEGDQKLYVHKDSHFYTIKEAYDAGYITTEDVAAFGPKVNNKFRKWDG